MVDEAKEPIEEQQKTTDEVVDEFFDKVETETPAESSPVEKPDETTDDAKADEDTTSQKSEEAKAEEEVPQEFHKHPAWQRILKERDEAKSLLAETDKGTDDADKQRIDKVLNSPSFVRAEMTEQGYKEEAINARLQELGHKVEAPPTNDVALVARELNIDLETMDANQKAAVTDIARIARIMAKDEARQIVSSEVEPLKEASLQTQRERNASTVVKQMQEVVTNEGVLDYKKDVEPEINKFLDANPDATQEDVIDHFGTISRQLTIGRLKQGAKQEQTNGKREANKPVQEGVVITPGKIPAKTGDVNTDMDNFLNAVDYR